MEKWFIIFASFLFSTTLLAQDEGYVEDSFFQGTEVLAGTELPFQIGARLKMQLPSNIHLTAGLGYIPEFYAETFGSVAGSVGIMGENTAELAALAFAGAFVLDARLAYSLDPDGGLYAELGYAMITGGKGDASGDVVESAYDFDYSGFGASDSLTVEGTVHAVTVHIGFLYLLSERMSLVFDMGVVKPVMADLDVTANGVTAATANQIQNDLKSYLEDTLVSESFIPTGSVWLSYLF